MFNSSELLTPIEYEANWVRRTYWPLLVSGGQNEFDCSIYASKSVVLRSRVRLLERAGGLVCMGARARWWHSKARRAARGGRPQLLPLLGSPLRPSGPHCSG